MAIATSRAVNYPALTNQERIRLTPSYDGPIWRGAPRFKWDYHARASQRQGFGLFEEGEISSVVA
jgi:hypothetical protein